MLVKNCAYCVFFPKYFAKLLFFYELKYFIKYKISI